MMFKVEAIKPPERCPKCGFDKLYKHSSRKQLIMDLPIHLKRVGLQVTVDVINVVSVVPHFGNALYPLTKSVV